MPDAQVNDLLFKIEPRKITVLEIVAEQQPDEQWKYTTAPFHDSLIGTPVGTRYAPFLEKIRSLQQQQKLNRVTQLLCNSSLAVELIVSKILTKEILEACEPAVAGAGRGMTTMIVIKNQTLVVEGNSLTVTIFIVDCFSIGHFECIDANNITL